MKKFMLAAAGNSTVTVPIPNTWANIDTLAKTNTIWGNTAYGGNYISTHRLAYGNSKVVAIGGDYVTSNMYCAISTDNGQTWTRNNGLVGLFPAYTDFLCLALAYGNGRFVASFKQVSDPYGTDYCATSTDGVNWTRNYNFESALSGTDYKPMSGCGIYGNKFVFGLWTGRVLTSTDGLSWTLNLGAQPISQYYSPGIESLSWDGSKYVATAGNAVMSSTDGLSWTLQYDLANIANWAYVSPAIPTLWNGSKYVIFGTQGKLVYSSNLTSWTLVNMPPAFGVDQAYGSVVLGSRFLGLNSVGGLITSTDGINWTYSDGILTTYWSTNGEYVWNAIATPSNFVVGGGPSFVTSSNGTTWSYSESMSGVFSSWGHDSINQGLSIATSGTTLVAVGTNGNCATSTDGSTWTNQMGIKNASSGGSGKHLNVIVRHGTRFVAYGAGGYGFTSTDGISWSIQNGIVSAWGNVDVNGLASNGSIIVAIGAGGKIATSTDGITWTNRTSLSSTAFGTTNCTSICYGGGKFIVGGESGKIATSTDGITWTYQSGLSSTSWATGTVKSIARDATKYVAVGTSGKCATSADGITWTYTSGLTSVGLTNDCNSIVWNGSMFMVTGNSVQAAYSLNGVDWTSVSAGMQTVWNTTQNGSSVNGNVVFWFNNKFIFLGNNGKIATLS